MTLAFWFGVNYFVAPDKLQESGLKEIAVPSEARFPLWKDTVRMALANPILGSGPDTFKSMYGRYATLNTTLYRADYAHNEYLQQLSDCGIVGLVTLVLPLILLGRSIARAYPTRRSRLFVGIGIGSALGALSFAIHSFFDFNMRIPSNLILFSMLVALAWSVLLTRERDEGIQYDYERTTLTVGKTKTMICIVLALIFLGGLFVHLTRDTLAARLRKLDGRDSSEKGLAFYSRPVKINSLDAANWHFLGDGLLEKKEYLKALEPLKEAKKRNSYDASIDYSLYRAFTGVGDMKLASSSIEDAVRNDRMNAQWYKIAGDHYMNTGELPLAVQRYRRALELEGSFASAIMKKYFSVSQDILLARQMLPDGSMNAYYQFISEIANGDNRGTALAQFLELFEPVKGNAVHYISFAGILSNKGDYGLVRELLKGRVSLLEDNRAYQFLGSALCKLGEYDEGVANFERGFELEPGNFQTLDFAFECLKSKNDVAKMNEILDRFSKKYSEKGSINYLRSKYHQANGDWLKAVMEAKEAIGKDVYNLHFRFQLGELYYERDMYVDAISEWKSILNLDSNAVWVKRHIAMAYEKIGKQEEAKRWVP